MKPILAALIVAAILDGAHSSTAVRAETAQPVRPLPDKPRIVIGSIDDRELYSNPLHCVYHERRSLAVHLLRCRFNKPCELTAAQPLSHLEKNFASAKIVKMAPLPDGCVAVTLVGKFKLSDAPPWAGSTYSGWRPFPPLDNLAHRGVCFYGVAEAGLTVFGRNSSTSTAPIHRLAVAARLVAKKP